MSDGGRILVVEDEEHVADTYELYLAGEYDVTAVYSGEEALQEVDDSYDVVLLDRQMPGMSGDEVLEEMRKRGLEVRIVLVTAVAPDFDIVDMECDDYVVKPVGKETLRKAVERALTVATYNDYLQELSSLRLKRNVIEVELSEYELQESDKYQRLTDEIERIESELEDLEDELDLESVEMYL